jgi:hypothetical protein
MIYFSEELIAVNFVLRAVPTLCRANDRDSDSGGDQTVFNCGRTGFICQKSANSFQGLRGIEWVIFRADGTANRAISRIFCLCGCLEI